MNMDKLHNYLNLVYGSKNGINSSNYLSLAVSKVKHVSSFGFNRNITVLYKTKQSLWRKMVMYDYRH